MFQLAGHFRMKDSTPQVVLDGLIQESKCQPVLIVVDDAHLLRDMDDIGFLEQAISAGNGRIAVLLAGGDEPGFVERVRSRGITTWRIPGFTLDECQALLNHSIGGLSPPQQAALAGLRDRTDGHPGIVWLCCDNIEQIKTIEDSRVFVASLDGGLGTGPDAFHAALFRTFQAGLSTQELELCRRLAIALHGFSRRLAEFLSRHDGSMVEFANTWDGCLLRAFDPLRTTRQQLPTLYRSGLLQRSTGEEKQTWHGIATV